MHMSHFKLLYANTPSAFPSCNFYLFSLYMSAGGSNCFFLPFSSLFHSSLGVTKVFLHLLQLGNEIRVDVVHEGSCSRHIFIIASMAQPGQRKQTAGTSGQVIFFLQEHISNSQKHLYNIFYHFLTIECP